MNAPRLTKADIVLTILPLLLWAVSEGVVNPLISERRCSQQPETCTHETVFWPDRLVFNFEGSAKADGISTIIQYAVGVSAVAVPMVIQIGFIAVRGMNPVAALYQFSTDVVILAQGATLNGLFNSIVRNIVQRPRPLVYKDPRGHGWNSRNYSSFYSGHTSFTAVICVALSLLLYSRGLSGWLVTGFSVAGCTAVFSTAILRVMAGRHFFTDVMAGMIFGSLMGFLMVWWHCRSGKKNAKD